MTLDAFGKIQASVPVVGKFKPSSGFNLTDYHEAGGVAALMAAIKEHINLDCEMPLGGRIGDYLARCRRTRRQDHPACERSAGEGRLLCGA